MQFTIPDLLKRHKIITLACIGLIALVIGYWFWPAGGPPAEIPFMVEAESVKRGDISKKVKLLATVKPKHQASFVSHQSGRLKAIYVEEGKPVAKGTLLADLENDETLREYKYSKVKSLLAKAQYDRMKQLYEQKSQSKASLDRAYDDWLKTEIEFEGYQDKLKNTQFIMPFDGTCGVFKVRVGQSVKEGEQIVLCYDTTAYILQFNVPESILNHVEAGQALDYKGQTGRISSVQKLLDPETHMGLAHAEIPNSWPVSVGQLISVKVETQKKSNVLTVPRSAVFIKGGQTFVYVIAEGKADLKPVQPGLTGQNDIEIIEGLKEGDKVILKGQENIWPTRAVKEIEKKGGKKEERKK